MLPKAQQKLHPEPGSCWRMENPFFRSCFRVSEALLERASYELLATMLPPSQDSGIAAGSNSTQKTQVSRPGELSPNLNSPSMQPSPRTAWEAMVCHDPVGHPMAVNTRRETSPFSLPSNPLPVGPVVRWRRDARARAVAEPRLRGASRQLPPGS